MKVGGGEQKKKGTKIWGARTHAYTHQGQITECLVVNILDHHRCILLLPDTCKTANIAVCTSLSLPEKIISISSKSELVKLARYLNPRSGASSILLYYCRAMRHVKATINLLLHHASPQREPVLWGEFQQSNFDGSETIAWSHVVRHVTTTYPWIEMGSQELPIYMQVHRVPYLEAISFIMYA